VDRVLVEEMETERNYWREFLKRIVSTVKFLAVRGLAFCGSNEKLVALRTVTSLADWNCCPSMTRSWQLTFKDMAAQDVAQHPIFPHKLAMNLSD